MASRSTGAEPKHSSASRVVDHGPSGRVQAGVDDDGQPGAPLEALEHPRDQRLVGAVDGLDARSPVDGGDDLCSTALSTLEAGFSARSLSDHRKILEWLTSAFTPLVIGERAQRVAVELQSALWRAGAGRAVGVVDPRVRARWVVPRGSVD